MKSVLQVGGWLLAILLLLCSGYLYMALSRAETNARLAEAAASAQRELAESEVAKMKAGRDENAAGLQARLDEALNEAAKLREQLQSMTSAAAGDDTGGTPNPEPDSAESAEKAAASDDSNAQNAGERIAQAQMGMMADMAYKNLFDDLNLPQDVRAQLRDAIAAYLLKEQQATVAAMGTKDRKASEVHAEKKAREAELRKTLANFLTADELAAWDEYEPVADQIMYERLVEGQLNMLASGLNADNRTLTSQVVAEELVREFDAFNASDDLYTRDNFNDAQARALSASLDRLGTALDENQYALVEGYVNQALTMFEAMSEREQPKQ